MAFQQRNPFAPFRGHVRCIRLEIDMSNRGLHKRAERGTYKGKGGPSSFIMASRHHGTMAPWLPGALASWHAWPCHTTYIYVVCIVKGYSGPASSSNNFEEKGFTAQIQHLHTRQDKFLAACSCFLFCPDYFCKLLPTPIPENKFKQIGELGSPCCPLKELSWACVTASVECEMCP